MQESKSCALPLGDSPKNLYFCRCKSKGGYRDSNPGPPEPQSGALTNCAIPTIIKFLKKENVLEGIRTPDPRLRRPLLYPAELRTHVQMRERVMGIEPTYPAWKAGVLPLNYTRKIGVTGFEPAASWSQTRRSSQAEPHPEGNRYPPRHPDPKQQIYNLSVTQMLLYRTRRKMSTLFFGLDII